MMTMLMSCLLQSCTRRGFFARLDPDGNGALMQIPGKGRVELNRQGKNTDNLVQREHTNTCR